MELHNQAYIPDGCPALIPECEGKGGVVTPDKFRFSVVDETDDGKPQCNRAGDHVAEVMAYFDIGGQEQFAVVIEAEYPVASPESKLLDGPHDDDDANQKLGGAYCERIEKCSGAIMRGDKLVCGALDPESFIPIVTAVYPE